MSENIEISEGLQFYFGSVQQQAAIDQMISQKKVPTDLSWTEIQQFNDARLSAHSIQVDYWKLLNTIWEQTRGKCYFSKQFNSVDPTWYDREYSLEIVWDEYFIKAYESKGKHLITSCIIRSKSNVQIGFFVRDKNEKYNISNDIELSDNWLSEADNERWTNIKLVPIKDQSQINIDDLSRLAKEVISKLEKVM